MDTVQLSQDAAMMPTLPHIPLQPRGGKWRHQRTFEPTVVVQTATAPDAEPEPTAPDHAATVEQAPVMADPCSTHMSNWCDYLSGECVTHTHADGEIIHRGPRHATSAGGDDNLLTHNLIQYGDGKPLLEFVGGGDWPDLDLPGVDALIEAVEQQLDSLRACRTQFATALGAGPETEPPEHQQVLPGDGAAGEQVQR